jgi:hypothetical protein
VENGRRSEDQAIEDYGAGWRLAPSALAVRDSNPLNRSNPDLRTTPAPICEK